MLTIASSPEASPRTVRAIRRGALAADWFATGETQAAKALDELFNVDSAAHAVAARWSIAKRHLAVYDEEATQF